MGVLSPRAERPGHVAGPGLVSLSLSGSGRPARRSRRAPGRVDGPGVSRPPPDAGIWAPGRGRRGETQARTCPLPGLRSPSRTESRGRRPGQRSGGRDPSPGDPRVGPTRVDRGRPGRSAGDTPQHTWAERGRGAGAPGSRRGERDPAVLSAGAPARSLRGRPSPSGPAHPSRQPISDPRAAPLPQHTPSPPPGPSQAAVCPLVRPHLSGSPVSVCTPVSPSVFPPRSWGRCSGLALTSLASLPQFPSRSLSVEVPGSLRLSVPADSLGGPGPFGITPWHSSVSVCESPFLSASRCPVGVSASLIRPFISRSARPFSRPPAFSESPSRSLRLRLPIAPSLSSVSRSDSAVSVCSPPFPPTVPPSSLPVPPPGA